MRPSFTYSRLLFPVIASAGAVGLSIGLMIPLTSIVLEQRGISIIAIGLNATVYSLAILLAGPFLPAIIHRIGLLKSMFAGALLSGAFVIGLSLDDSLWLWFLLRFCMGFSGGMHWVGSETWINEVAPEQHRGRIVGAYATIWSMGIAGRAPYIEFHRCRRHTALYRQRLFYGCCHATPVGSAQGRKQPHRPHTPPGSPDGLYRTRRHGGGIYQRLSGNNRFGPAADLRPSQRNRNRICSDTRFCFCRRRLRLPAVYRLDRR
jgi:hypothetical protein